MADDALKVKVQLEATTDTKQVQKEATEVADTAQKVLDKKQLKLKLEDNLSDLKKKLEETRVAYQNLLNQPMGWTTDKQLQKLEDQMEDLRGEIKENEKAINDLWWSSNKLGWIFQNLIGKISALWAAMKVFSTLKKIFTDFQDSQKTLVQATGASGQALRDLTDSMLDVQGKVRQNQQEIAEAVWELNTRLWLTWQQLTDFTTKYLKFASVTGQDWKTAIESNVKMFSIWWVSIDKQAEYLDKLTVAWQKTWISVQNLTNLLQTNAPALQELWLSLDDSIALLSNFEQAWIEASSVLASMKIWIKNLVEWWATPSEALEEIVDKIQNAKSNTEAMNYAFEIFWSRWGLAMYNAIKNGTFQLGKMKEAFDDVNGAVENTFESMETWSDFFSRTGEQMKSRFTSWQNEEFQRLKRVWWYIGELNDYLASQAKLIWEVWNEERVLVEVDWKYYAVQTEKWKAIEENNKKLQEQEAFQKQVEEATKNYTTTVDKAVTAVETFNAIKTNQKATRDDFDATKQKALEEVSALNTLLATLQKFHTERLANTKSKSWGWTDMQAILELQKERRTVVLEMNRIKNATFQWTDKTEDDWGILWDELLWWSWWSGWWSSKSKAEDMLESFGKEMKELYSDMDSSVTEHQKKLDTAKNNIKKVEDQYDKLRDAAKKTWEDAEKSIKSYNEQLEKNQSEAITNLGQRYVELKKELMGADEWMKKRAEELSWKEIQSMQEQWSTEYRGYELKDLIELKEKLEEIQLIEENTTEEQRKSDEFTRKTSKAQEILNNLNEKAAELEEKKATALEKQAIAQSVMNQENWKQNIVSLTKNWEDIGTYYYDIMEETRKKIEDEENVQYAKQLENQSVNLKDQLDQYTQEKNEEVEILIDITARKQQLETEYTKVFQEQVAKQKQSVNDLIQRWETLIAKKNEYYWTSSSVRAYGWDISNAKVSLVWENWPEQIIARTASYVQPRNASNSYSTINNNNQSSFSINGMNINVNNVDEFLDELRQRMTYRN